MKASDVKTAEQCAQFIEGCLNDFEDKISTKEETFENIVDLVAHVIKMQKDRE